MTPNLAWVRVATPRWSGFSLWLPLFLLWIPIILLAPVILLVVCGLSVAGRINPWQAIGTGWAIACSLTGTRVQVDCPEATVQVKLI